MSPEEWARLRAEFEATEELPAAERELHLAELARTSPALAFHLRRLLAAADSAGRRVLDFSIPERLAVLAPGLPDAPAPSRDLTGEVLKQRYRVESLLGSGGSSEVWLARDERLAGRKVVIKVPHAAMSGEGFQSEVEALSGVHHPGIAHPLDSGAMDDQTLFLVLEWVEGRSLREILQREGRLDYDAALQVTASVADALDAVHRVGVLHLDVKPENVMVQRSGANWRAVLVDFGIARSQRQAGADSRLQGSPCYMAPERFAGLDSPAADVYSLGVLALEMLSGQSVIANAVKLRPRALRDALASALDPDPRARPASAGELAFRLRRANQLWRRQLAAVAVSLTLLASLLGYIMFHRQARARQVRESVWNKEFALALGGLDALGPAQQGRQFLGLWRFVNSETNDPEKLESAAEILILVGMQYGHPGHRHLGQSATAESTLQKARRMADKAMALAPTRWHAKKLAAQSRDALGSVLIEMGRYQEAEQILLDGLRISEGEPRVVGIRAGLFGSLSRIAFHHRDWPRCLQFRNQLVETRRQLWAANQPAIGFAVDYAGALAARGYLFREMADYPAASRDYAESDRVLGHGIVMSPDNQQVAWQLARNSLEVGRTLLLAGDVNAACLRLEKACERLRQFHRDDSMDQATVRELALSLAWLGKARKQARLAARSWQPPLAEAVRLATAAAQHDPASAKAADNLAAIQSIAGELQLARMSGESRNRSGRRSIGLPPPTAAVAEPKTN